MPLIQCPSCGSRLRFSEAKAGRQGKCPQCGIPIMAPEAVPTRSASPPHGPADRLLKAAQQERRPDVPAEPDDYNEDDFVLRR